MNLLIPHSILLKLRWEKILQTTNNILLYTLIFLIPTQLGMHFFIPESYISGIRIDYLAPTLYMTDLVIIILALITLYSILQTKKRTILTKKIQILFYNKLVMGIFCLVCINIIFSIEPILSLYKYLKLFECIVLFFLIRSAQIPINNVLRIILFSALLQLVLVIQQIFHHGSVQGIWYFFGERSFDLGTPGIAKISLQGIEMLRGYGTFSHPNSLAGFYLLLYGFVLFYKPFQKHALLQKLFFATSSLLIFFSFSKIAIIGFLGFTIYKILHDKSNCVICRLSQIILPIVLASIFLSGGGDPDSMGKRFWLMMSSIQIIKENILGGVGFGNYLISQSKFSIPYSYFFLQPVHNIFLLAIAELGIPLVFFIFYFLFQILKQVWKSPAIRVVFIIILFTGMFDHYWLTLQQNILLIPVVFGLLQSEKM